MSLAQPTDSKNRGTTVLEHILDGRRQILAALIDRTEPLSIEELADELAAGNPREQNALHIELVHRHLPALEDADLVTWDRVAGAVTTTDNPALTDPNLRRIVGRENDWGEVVECLADEYRRNVLAVLKGEGSTSQRALARAVAEQEGGGKPSEGAVEETMVALHHVHLPKLADAGLIEYDSETGTVAYSARGPFESVMEFYSDD